MKFELNKPEIDDAKSVAPSSSQRFEFVDFWSRLDAIGRLNQPYLKQYRQEFQAFTWVQLVELHSPFSFDQALLLCQHSDEQWVAWIPDHGEIVLHTNQFC